MCVSSKKAKVSWSFIKGSSPRFSSVSMLLISIIITYIHKGMREVTQTIQLILNDPLDRLLIFDLGTLVDTF